MLANVKTKQINPSYRGIACRVGTMYDFFGLFQVRQIRGISDSSIGLIALFPVSDLFQYAFFKGQWIAVLPTVLLDPDIPAFDHLLDFDLPGISARPMLFCGRGFFADILFAHDLAALFHFESHFESRIAWRNKIVSTTDTRGRLAKGQYQNDYK